MQRRAAIVALTPLAVVEGRMPWNGFVTCRLKNVASFMASLLVLPPRAPADVAQVLAGSVYRL